MGYIDQVRTIQNEKILTQPFALFFGGPEGCRAYFSHFTLAGYFRWFWGTLHLVFKFRDLRLVFDGSALIFSCLGVDASIFHVLHSIIHFCQY
jgi:hypothetical protein